MKYRKKPVVVEAFLWDSSIAFHSAVKEWPLWFQDALDVGKAYFTEGKLQIRTLEGVHTADIGDYIIRGVAGELYPCKGYIFQLTYEEV